MTRRQNYYRLRLRFETLAAVLRLPRYASARRRTLAYWTSVADQSVPYALLDQTVQDILTRGFDSVARSPGVGEKKLTGLMQILDRVRIGSQELATMQRDTGGTALSVWPPSDRHEYRDGEGRSAAGDGRPAHLAERQRNSG